MTTRTIPRPTFLPFRTPVRGHAFAARPPGSAGPAPDQPIRLRREPGNPADPLAVAVWVEGEDTAPWRIGYLERAVAARLAPRLDRGELQVTGRVVGWVEEPGGRWERPLVTIVPLAARATSDGRPLAAEDGAPSVWGQPARSVVRRVGAARAG